MKNLINKIQKEKTYSFTKLGYVKMMYERNKEIQDKFSRVGYYAILVLLLGFGLLSKEFLIAIAVNEGISKVAYYVIK